VPASCGVYVMYKDNAVHYVGASKGIRKRFSNHNIKDWDMVKIKPMPTFGDAHTLEEKLIQRLNPPMNSSGSHRSEISTRHRITINHELYIGLRNFCANKSLKMGAFINEILTDVFKGITDAEQIEN